MGCLERYCNRCKIFGHVELECRTCVSCGEPVSRWIGEVHLHGLFVDGLVERSWVVWFVLEVYLACGARC